MLKQIKSKEDLENIHSRRKKYKFENIKLHYKENKGKALFCVEIDNKKIFHPVESKKETIEKRRREYADEKLISKKLKRDEQESKRQRKIQKHQEAIQVYKDTLAEATSVREKAEAALRDAVEDDELSTPPPTIVPKVLLVTQIG